MILAQNNKIIVMIATLLFAAIGLIVSLFLSEILVEQAASQTGSIKDLLDILTEPNTLSGLVWLIICVICFYGVKQVIDEGENVGPISVYFLLIWIGAIIGILIGNIVWLLIKGQQITLDLDTLIASTSLIFSLAPSFAAALGVSTKGR